MSTTIHSLKHKASNTTEKGLGRAHEILQAARSLLASEGYAGLSMRAVASKVGISLSNVQHYYQSKDALLEAALQYTLDEFQAKMDRIRDEMQHAPRIDQFLSMIDMFLDEITDPVNQALFFEIWALASHNAFASELMGMMMGRERKAIYLLIRGLNPAIPDEETMQRAILIVAQVEGLMPFRLGRNTRGKDFQSLRAILRKAIINLATVA